MTRDQERRLRALYIEIAAKLHANKQDFPITHAVNEIVVFITNARLDVNREAVRLGYVKREKVKR